MNLPLAEKVLRTCQTLGVQEYCICAGARNAPLVLILAEAQGIKLYNFYDERSAAFFALGRIKATQQPVAVVTTSGTAVAELLPAAVEATYGGYPLILLTADRPRSYRGTGAPQSIDQVGLFSTYVETCWDVENLNDDWAPSNWSGRQPLQINVCFSEPLVSGPLPTLNLGPSRAPSAEAKFQIKPSQVRKIKKPLILVGGLNATAQEREMIIEFLQAQRVPIYAEAFSGLRGESRLKNSLLLTTDVQVEKLFEQGICQTVFRLGGVPTLRFWRDLEHQFRQIPVYSLANTEWTGLSRPTFHTLGLENIQLFQIEALTEGELQAVSSRHHQFQEHIQRLCQRLPKSEAALLYSLARNFQGPESLYLGNSLPIRQWDLIDFGSSPLTQIEANRGANGIDGQVSTFLGWAEGTLRSQEDLPQSREAWAVLGDLTSLYDLGGLWITAALSSHIRRRLVVINNQGGQIFRKMTQGQAFVNSHSLNFEAWAKMWGWAYLQPEAITAEFCQSLRGREENLIIELKPLQQESDQFWQGYPTV